MREELRSNLEQAQEALLEAQMLLFEGAELNFVINSLYYAFLYPVLGLLKARKTSALTQSTAISLFEREFVQNGEFDPRFLTALRRSFELKPSCACEKQKEVKREDIEQLLPIAREFLERVRQVAQ